MDRIHIKNLEIFAHHGVFPEENTLGQKFVVSATLYTDTSQAGRTDDLTQSIHYGEVSQRLKQYVEGHTFKLLERVAEGAAEDLLLHIPRLEQVDLEVKKPWAPVGLPLETVSVEITRGWHTAYVALGSNLQLRTLLSPPALLARLHEIEQAAGRERKIHWGPRTLDLDILFYDQEILDLPELTIPHRDMQNRDFVLFPLEEIAPWVRHPVLGKTVLELAEALRSREAEPCDEKKS